MEFDKFVLTVLALEELKEKGYSEVWIGKVDCPFWDWKSDSVIIAHPKSRQNSWQPSLWSVSEKLFGKMSCGNGLKNADQGQFNHKLMEGHYKLENNSWQTNIFDKEKTK